jgi:flavodoxin
MKTPIIFDSLYGNMEKVAEGIGEAAGGTAEVTAMRIGDKAEAHLAGLVLLVVGGGGTS